MKKISITEVTHCFVLVGTKNRSERDLTIKLRYIEGKIKY